MLESRITLIGVCGVLLVLLRVDFSQSEVNLLRARQGIGCPSTSWYWDYVSGRCLMLTNETKTYEVAKSTCSPGRLVRVDNNYIFEVILSSFTDEPDEADLRASGFWVGTKLNSSTGRYQFDGSNDDIDDYFTTGDVIDTSKHCIMFSQNTMISNDCGNSVRAMCEFSPTGKDRGCPLGFYPYAVHNDYKCIMMRLGVNDYKSFQSARRSCYKHGANLIAGEEACVMAQIKDESFWLGLTTVAKGKVLTWINGYKADWTNFADTNDVFPADEQSCFYNSANKWNRMSCTDAAPYVCMRPKWKPSENGGCPGDSFRYVETGRCYTWYDDVYKTKSEARQLCQEKGAILASKPSGLNERFTHLISSFGEKTWYAESTMPLSEKATVLCEFFPDAEKCGKEGYFYHEHLKSCFRIEMTNIKNWFEGRSKCQSEGGDLIKMDTKEKYDFVLMTMTRSVSIAGWRVSNDAIPDFRWVADNSSVNNSFALWGDGEPNHTPPGEYCMDIHDRSRGIFNLHIYHKLNDISCKFKSGYICERKI